MLIYNPVYPRPRNTGVIIREVLFLSRYATYLECGRRGAPQISASFLPLRYISRRSCIRFSFKTYMATVYTSP